MPRPVELTQSLEPVIAFRAAVAASPRLRRPLALERDEGPFVIAGHPKHWGGVASRLAAAGARLLAFHDLRFESARLLYRRRPVWHGRRSGPLAGRTVVLAGPVHKRYFDGAPPDVGACRYAEPLSGWRQSGHESPAWLTHVEALAALWASLEDEASRAVFASVVRARAEGDAGFHRVSTYREYDHPVVRARPGDTVLDVGAFWGDSARRFAWQLRGRGTIVALEPTPQNYRRLCRQKLPGLIPLCLGAWHEHGVLKLDARGGSSRIDSKGDTPIHVAPIDWVVEALELERVDLIKLDVEGAEREALAGAARTLRRFRPKVQLSVYHRRNDLFELPAALAELLDGCRLYVGHHGPYHTETDLYAIPHERLAATPTASSQP